MQKERDAREARLLDFEIRRAHEKDRKKEAERQQHITKHQQHQQPPHQPQSQSEKSTPSSICTQLSEIKSPRETSEQAHPSGTGGGKTKSVDQEKPSTSQKSKKDSEKSHRKVSE